MSAVPPTEAMTPVESLEALLRTSKAFSSTGDRHRVFGVLTLGKHQENGFAKRDIEALMQVANQVAIAVENAPAYGSTWLSLQRAVLCVSALVILLFPETASAANLKAETRTAWEEYVVAANAQMHERLGPNHAFLLSDEDPVRAAKLRSGEILV